MSPFRRFTRAALGGAFVAGTLAAAGVPANTADNAARNAISAISVRTEGSAGTAPAAPAHVARYRPRIAAPAGHGRRSAGTASTNWAGYAATGATYTNVSATFTQPAVNCGSTDSYSAFWVGLDGYTSPTVEQTGTEADCVGGVASYTAWVEVYPSDPVQYSVSVRPGDVLTASVAYTAPDRFTLTLADATAGWHEATGSTLAGADRSSAEVVTEAPYSTQVLPLADFGTAAFHDIQVNGQGFSSLNPSSIDMVTATGLPKATVSPLSANAFTVTWNSP